MSLQFIAANVADSWDKIRSHATNDRNFKGREPVFGG